MVILTIYQAVINLPFFNITEFITQTGITIYGDFPVTQIRLTEIAEIYPRLWEDKGFIVRVFPENWMSIDILFDVKIKTVKIYFLKPVDRKIVDDIFDKLHVQKRMEFIT